MCPPIPPATNPPRSAASQLPSFQLGVQPAAVSRTRLLRRGFCCCCTADAIRSQNRRGDPAAQELRACCLPSRTAPRGRDYGGTRGSAEGGCTQVSWSRSACPARFSSRSSGSGRTQTGGSTHLPRRARSPAPHTCPAPEISLKSCLRRCGAPCSQSPATGGLQEPLTPAELFDFPLVLSCSAVPRSHVLPPSSGSSPLSLTSGYSHQQRAATSPIRRCRVIQHLDRNYKPRLLQKTRQPDLFPTQRVTAAPAEVQGTGNRAEPRSSPARRTRRPRFTKR